jgi:hypothetical protein
MAIPKISQHNIFNSYYHPSLSLSFLSSSTPLSSILSPFRLRSVFFAAPLPPSISFRRIRSTCALSSHSPRGTSCTSSSVQYLFSLSSFLHLNLAIIFLSFALSLPRYTGTYSVMHFSYSLLLLRFSNSLPSLLLVRISVPLAQLNTHPSSFRSQSFHFLTGIPIPPAVLLSFSFSSAFFLFSL